MNTAYNLVKKGSGRLKPQALQTNCTLTDFTADD